MFFSSEGNTGPSGADDPDPRKAATPALAAGGSEYSAFRPVTSSPSTAAAKLIGNFFPTGVAAKATASDETGCSEVSTTVNADKEDLATSCGKKILKR